MGGPPAGIGGGPIEPSDDVEPSAPADSEGSVSSHVAWSMSWRRFSRISSGAPSASQFRYCWVARHTNSFKFMVGSGTTIPAVRDLLEAVLAVLDRGGVQRHRAFEVRVFHQPAGRRPG